LHHAESRLLKLVSVRLAIPGSRLDEAAAASRAFGSRVEAFVAVAIDEFKHHDVGRRSRYAFLSAPRREWIERGKALAVVLLILVLGLVSGYAFGAYGVSGAASRDAIRTSPAFV
jgi:hypothetical protein